MSSLTPIAASPVSELLPSWALSNLPTMRYGDTTVHSIVTLRRDRLLTASGAEAKPTIFYPLAAHIETLKSAIQRTVPELRSVLFPQNTYRSLEALTDWIYGDSTITDPKTGKQIPDPSRQMSKYGMKVNQQSVNDELAIPGLVSVSYNYEPGTLSRGTAEFFIPNRVLAEGFIMAFWDAAIRQDRILQFYLPFMRGDIQNAGAGKWVIAPTVAGPIIDVRVTEYPYRLTVTFGSIADRDSRNTTQQQVFVGKTGFDVLKQMCDAIRVTPLTWLDKGGKLTIGSPPELDSPGMVDLGGRSIRDGIEEFLRQRGLRWQWFEGLGPVPTVLQVTSMRDAPHRTNVFSKALDLAKESAAVRQAYDRIGLGVGGVFNLFLPWGMEPSEARLQAALYAATDDSEPRLELMRFLAGVAGGDYYRNNSGGTPAGALYGGSYLNQWFQGMMQWVAKPAGGLADLLKTSVNKTAFFNLIPIYNLDQISYSRPPADSLANLKAASMFSPTGTRLNTVSGAEAGRILGVQPSNGIYEFPGDGKNVTRAGPNDPVILQQQGGSTAGARVFPNAVQFPGVAGADNQVEPQYPYTAALEIAPMYAAFPGLPSFVAGLRPLDGAWEFHRLEMEIAAETQLTRALLRSDRIPIYASPVK